MKISSRSGNVETVRVDEQKKNKEQEKFDKFFNFYRNTLMNVSISIKTLEEITKDTNANKLFYQYCPSFRSAVVNNFWAQCVIELNECFRGRTYGFNKFINFVEANWSKIYTGKWIETTTWSDGEIEKQEITFNWAKVNERLNKCKNELNKQENLNALEKIKSYRDKVFAHADDIFPNTKLFVTELREIFTMAEKIFNSICSMYDNVHRFLEPTNSDDVRNVTQVIETYEENRDLILENEREKLYKEIYGDTKIKEN